MRKLPDASAAVQYIEANARTRADYQELCTAQIEQVIAAYNQLKVVTDVIERVGCCVISSYKSGSREWVSIFREGDDVALGRGNSLYEAAKAAQNHIDERWGPVDFR